MRLGIFEVSLTGVTLPPIGIITWDSALGLSDSFIWRFLLADNREYVVIKMLVANNELRMSIINVWFIINATSPSFWYKRD